MLLLFVCSSLFVFFSLVLSEEREPHPRISFLWDNLDLKKPLNESAHFIRTSDLPVQLICTPNKITSPLGYENITISWANSTNALSGDWIGIYSPDNSTDSQYLDWFYTDGTISGSYIVRLWNMRTDYSIRYFLNKGNSVYVLQGETTVYVDPIQPLQGHLSLTSNSPYEMELMWVSALVDTPKVKVGTKSGVYDVVYDKVNSYTYDTTWMCGGEAQTISPTRFRDPGYMYDVILDNLKENTKYYYIFGSDDYYSIEYSFTTSTSSETDSESDATFKFVMYGDMGVYNPSFNTLNRVSDEDNLELLLHVGDLSYAEGWGFWWDQWVNMIQVISTNVPYMVSIGNHEYDHTSPSTSPNGKDVSGAGGTGYHPSWGNMGDDSDGECGAPSYFRFKAPNNGNSIFWYSFNYKSVHFIMLSSEHNYTSGSNGSDWLINDLQNVNNTLTPWIIVNIHRPLYCSQQYSSDNVVSINLVQILEPTFYSYKVDVVLTGHFHSYQRSCAVYNYTCIGSKNGGITHIMIGSAGISLSQAKFKPESWSEYWYDTDWGYGRFYVNRTSFYCEYITNTHGKVVDSVLITK